MSDQAGEIIELPLDTLDEAALREAYCLLDSEDPREFMALLRELTQRHRPRDALERNLVEDAALGVFRQRRADRLEAALEQGDAVPLDAARRRELASARRTVARYRDAALRQYRAALHRLRGLQRSIELPSAEVIDLADWQTLHLAAGKA
jgi:hypothetical protein